MQKQIYTLIFLFVLSSQIVFAQSFKGGVLAALSTSQINGDGFGGFNKFGGSAGFFVSHKLEGKYTGNLELRFTQKGSSLAASNIRIQVNYIEVPVFVSYSVNDKLQILAGLTPAIKVFETTEVNFILNSSSDFWKWDMPYLIGFEYPLSKKVRFDARYTMSTIPVSWRYYNMCVYFGLHYLLRE